MDNFTKAYIEAALWSSTDGQDRPLDENYTLYDLAPITLVTMRKDCEDFQAANADLLAQWFSEAGETSERAGHDFWLTRNRHGAGFWDRWSGATPQAELGARLTEAAHAYGESNLYVGDDGLIYL